MLMLLPPVFESLPSSFVKHNIYWEYPTTPINGAKKNTWPGDIDVVHCLLCVEQIQVFGQEIFDRRYPGFVLSKDHKSCIKSHGYQLLPSGRTNNIWVV